MNSAVSSIVESSTDVKAVRYPVETGLLIALCFFLPLFEAPKSLLWLAYAFAWTVNRVRERDFGGPWGRWDTLIAVWIGSGFVVALFAGLDGDEWSGAGDLLRYASVLWLVRRARYGRREMRWILGMLVTSTVVGLAIAHLRLWPDPDAGPMLELHSVGHVNHTAIYLAIVLGICAAWIFTRWASWRAGTRAVGIAIAALVLASLVVTASRAAIGVGLALLPLLALAWWPRSRLPMAIAMLIVSFVAGAAIIGGAEVVRKHWNNVDAHNVLSYRDSIWRVAFAAWRQHPWFGVGMDNYSRITGEHVRAWDAAAGRKHEPSRYFYISHAHSLFANTLAERGIFGALVLAAVLAAWAYSMVRYRPTGKDPDEKWLVWSCAAAAWIVTVVAGLVNTTLHHEHGLLATLLLGLWLSTLSGIRASAAETETNADSPRTLAPR